MIDINIIRKTPEIVKENIKKKFQDEKLPLVDEVKELDKKVREVQVKADTMKADKNKKSAEIEELSKFLEILDTAQTSYEKMGLDKRIYKLFLFL